MRPISDYGEGGPGDVKADVKMKWGSLQISGASRSNNKKKKKSNESERRKRGGRKKSFSSC